MFKPLTLFIACILLVSGYWFYQQINSPQLDNTLGERTRVSNLPWQITVVSPNILHVIDIDVGKMSLGQAVHVLKSEYKLAWFENKDESISLEAYFSRVSLSGLPAKVILELETADLNKDYLKKNSGQPEILKSHAIKYPVDDLAQEMSGKIIKSLTYVPKSSIEPELLQDRFGQAEEVIVINENTEFWLYPKKGLSMMIDKKGKEAFQYVPIADFSRLKKMALATRELSRKNNKK